MNKNFFYERCETEFGRDLGVTGTNMGTNLE